MSEHRSILRCHLIDLVDELSCCIITFHTLTHTFNNPTTNPGLQLCVSCHVFKTGCLLAQLFFSSTELAFPAKLQANQSFPPETEIPGCVS